MRAHQCKIVAGGTVAKVRHARPCAGHPRLNSIAAIKTWMAGTSSAKTRFALLPGHDEEIDRPRRNELTTTRSATTRSSADEWDARAPAPPVRRYRRERAGCTAGRPEIARNGRPAG